MEFFKNWDSKKKEDIAFYVLVSASVLSIIFLIWQIIKFRRTSNALSKAYKETLASVEKLLFVAEAKLPTEKSVADLGNIAADLGNNEATPKIKMADINALAKRIRITRDLSWKEAQAEAKLILTENPNALKFADLDNITHDNRNETA
jgi:hypothetical protein